MADNSALLASLLLGQKQRPDPIEAQRKYGQDLIVKSSSTAPLASGSPIEGIARVLQGALGGLTAGYADQLAQERGQKTVAGLSAALQANTPEEAAKALQGAGGDPDTVASSLAQLLSQKGDRYTKDALATRAFGAAGGTMPGAQGGGISTAPLPAPGGYQGTLGGRESSNNSQAVNPQSGAAGQFQFMPATWAEVRKSNPDLNLPDSPLQAPPQLQAAAEERFRAQNAKTLQGAGIQPTPANLYLAHRAGAQGAQAILGASPDAPLSTVVPPEWIAQNPDMRTTVGQFLQMAQSRFPGQGGQQPGQPLQIDVNNRPPQGSADGPSMPQPQGVPQAPAQPQISPAAAELMKQAQAAFQGGDPARAAALQQKAQETQAAHQGELEKRRYAQAEDMQKRSADALEHDRREANKPPNKEQSDAGGFADRMTNSFRILGQNEKEGLSTKGRMLDAKVFGVGVPGANYGQSEGYQQFRQAKDDFINAQLRRESGAVISDGEYASADRQYFPQPGDAESVVKQKLKNRQLVVDAMTRAAGPGYTLNPAVNQPTDTAPPPKSSAAQAKISTDAEFDALPPGTLFVGPDGQTRRKP